MEDMVSRVNRRATYNIIGKGSSNLKASLLKVLGHERDELLVTDLAVLVGVCLRDQVIELA